MLLEGHKLAALLDTGAKPSVIDHNTLSELNLHQEVIKESGKVLGLCDTPIDVLGYIDAKVGVGKHPIIKLRLQVLDSDSPTFILGRTFMGHFREVAFDFEGGRVKLGNEWEPVQATVSGSNPIAIAYAVKDETAEPLDDSLGRELINKRLDEEEITKVQELLAKFPTLFAENPKRPTRVTQSFAHCLELVRSDPIWARPRRIPPAWEEEVERQVKEMCKNGICRPSKSSWASDVVLVRKKDGQMRFAIDYRQLNAVTTRDAYGPPNPQSILDKLKGSRYFSSIDVANAYWCVPMREIDIPKTAFYTPRGLYEMTVMPFGMVNAGSTFQRLMGLTLAGEVGVESYVDDILVFSSTFEEHIVQLREVFRRLSKANIQLRESKCQLLRAECEFLGHLITHKGRRATMSYLEKIAAFPPPRTLRELQRFLGTINYYREYIPQMAEIDAPLYSLTKKGVRWIWTDDCENAFKKLRLKLVDEPVVLAFPAWAETFYIESDASASGVAAVLSQKDATTGKLRPIRYFLQL